MLLIYNCGYKSSLTIKGKVSNKWYVFKKRFVTEVNEEDASQFLEMTHKDIAWCPTESKRNPPFMILEDWCSGKEGRMDSKPYKIYDATEYKKLFLLK